MEKAIFISKIKNLKFVTREYSRLYFGVEFCQRLIPPIEDLDCILRFIFEKKVDFTFVTPYVTNEGMEKLKLLLTYLIKQLPRSEIVFNDWGILRWINQEYSNLNLVLGRLLNKQKRGPRILSIMDRVSNDTIQHFRQSNIDNLILNKFLESKSIKRIEFDNLLQEIDRSNNSLRGSLYFPFAYITTTRFCLIGGSYQQKVNKPLRRVSSCNKECQDYTFKLQHRQMPVELFLKGNTQFFKNDNLPRNPSRLNIDRLVYQPEIPL